MLKLYGISSLNPQAWENVDHEKEGPLAGTLTGEDGGMAEEMDPLGLRGRLAGFELLDQSLVHPLMSDQLCRPRLEDPYVPATMKCENG